MENEAREQDQGNQDQISQEASPLIKTIWKLKVGFE